MKAGASTIALIGVAQHNPAELLGRGEARAWAPGASRRGAAGRGVEPLRIETDLQDPGIGAAPALLVREEA